MVQMKLKRSVFSSETSLNEDIQSLSRPPPWVKGNSKFQVSTFKFLSGNFMNRSMLCILSCMPNNSLIRLSICECIKEVYQLNILHSIIREIDRPQFCIFLIDHRIYFQAIFQSSKMSSH
ncbi:hypothetical protein M514_18011 [Trichuris suis]|uniref:Uncharacterized protein n=1 Tax=Trichuris suis TaxID=68888 RepID=A0A085NK93_9BILA|nr:hypothetical protein M514_18011 [Trichuris suis]